MHVFEVDRILHCHYADNAYTNVVLRTSSCIVQRCFELLPVSWKRNVPNILHYWQAYVSILNVYWKATESIAFSSKFMPWFLSVDTCLFYIQPVKYVSAPIQVVGFIVSSTFGT